MDGNKKRSKVRMAVISTALCVMTIPVLTGCELIDMALTDAGIVKDEDGGRRFITHEEMKEAEELGRLNVSYEVVSSEKIGNERFVKVAITDDPLKATENDIKLIADDIWLDTNKEADFTKLEIDIYDRVESIKRPYTVGRATFVTKEDVSVPEDYIYLSSYDISYDFGDAINGFLPKDNPNYSK